MTFFISGDKRPTPHRKASKPHPVSFLLPVILSDTPRYFMRKKRKRAEMQSCPFVCLCGCCRDPGLWSVSRCNLQLHRLLCLQQTWKVWTPTLLAALVHPHSAAHPQARRRSSAACRIPLHPQIFPASSNLPVTTLSLLLMLTRVSLLHLKPSGTICEESRCPRLCPQLCWCGSYNLCVFLSSLL